MNTVIDKPLRLVFANESSIEFREAEDQAPANVIVVHLPWPAPDVQAAPAIDDDLANATWEDAEWQ